MESQQFLDFLDRFSEVFRESLGGLSMCVGLSAGESGCGGGVLQRISVAFYKASDA